MKLNDMTIADIHSAAEKASQEYAPMYRKVAESTFREGACWAYDHLTKEGNGSAWCNQDLNDRSDCLITSDLMDKASALSNEAIEVDRISLEDSDLEGLRGKVGDRFIVVTKDMIKESINRDIGDIQQKLEGYICDSAQHTRECIRIACNQMVSYILKKHSFAGCWYDLSKEQQEACLIELNKRVDQAMKDITGMPDYEERAK